MAPSQKPVLITKGGYEEKKAELNQLRLIRVKAVEELSWARDMGDRSENAAYKSARIKLSDIDRKMRYLESVLRRAEVIEKRTDGAVGIGSTVTILMNGTEMEYTIVGGHESQIAQRKLSLFSPIGKSLMGRRQGDRVMVEIPSGRVEITILTVK